MMTSTINIKSQECHFFSVTHANASLSRTIIYTSHNPKYARPSVALPSWVNSKLKKSALPLKLVKRMQKGRRRDSKGAALIVIHTLAEKVCEGVKVMRWLPQWHYLKRKKA
jgi:hypothetical protein